jgi:hypothetical protein
MDDFKALMRVLSTPRPNGSRAERETRRSLQGWLQEREIPYTLHSFRLYPYFFEAVGAWLILSRLLLAISIWLRWGWPSLPIALIGLAGGFLDTAFHLPLVTWPGMQKGENILITFDPASPPCRELVLSAHYDSKTELLDHRQRMFFLRNLPLGIFLTLALGLLGPLDRALLDVGSAWAPFTWGIGLVLSLVLLFLASGLSLSMLLGRLVSPSQGAVDNGAACAALLALADYLANGREDTGQDLSGRKASSPTKETRVTIALFGGEEVNMQGSRAYARGREWPLPAANLNLEIIAQDGDYVIWERDGNSFHLEPTNGALNQAVCRAVAEITGELTHPSGPVNSDGSSFQEAGIPVAVLGTYDSRLGDSGFHRPTDHIGRVKMERLPETVQILEKLIELFDHEGTLARRPGHGRTKPTHR